MNEQSSTPRQHDTAQGAPPVAGDLLLRGCAVPDQDWASLRSADLGIRDGVIVEVGPDLPVERYRRVVDAAGRIALPGLVNAHTHAHNALGKHTNDRMTLEELRACSAMLLEGRGEHEQYLSALLCAVENARYGTTSVFDLCAASGAPDARTVETVARAYGEVGLRATVAVMVADDVAHELPRSCRADSGETDGGGADASPTAAVVEVVESSVAALEGAYGGLVGGAVAPVVPALCTDTLLEECARIAAERGVYLHTHLAESPLQPVVASEKWGRSIVAHLDRLGVLSERFLGAHGVHLAEEEMATLAAAGAGVVHNPASNLKLGNGIAPVRRLLDHGVTVMLGTDGGRSSDNQDLFESMRLAALVSRVGHSHAPQRWLGAADVLTMAIAAGRQLHTAPSPAGVQLHPEPAASLRPLSVGDPADLVLLDGKALPLVPVNHLASALVYAGASRCVDTVIVAGELVVEDGAMVSIDERALLDEVAEIVGIPKGGLPVDGHPQVQGVRAAITDAGFASRD